MRGDIDVQDATAIVAEDDEYVEQLERQRRDAEEVTTCAHGEVIAQEGARGLLALRVTDPELIKEILRRMREQNYE